MPRALVTPELAETLRSLRLQNKIQAKSIALHIGKSAAFISRLENGNIQTIDTEQLYSILKFISGEENCSELADKIYKSLKIKCSPKEIEEQLWFVNYDTVECLLPIPESLIDEINFHIEKLGISREYLNSRINANEALSIEENEDNSIPYNQWYHLKKKDDNSQSIKIKLSENQLNGILDKKIDVSPYVFVFCILLYVLKIEEHGDTVVLLNEQNSELMHKTTEILNSHKFYSISERNAIIAEKETKEEIQEIFSSFDKRNSEIVSDIISGFLFATERNIKNTNEQLKAFSDNMHWDLGFMLRIISMEFFLLEKTSVSNKKNLLMEIEELIEKYVSLPDDQNKIEEY